MIIGQIGPLHTNGRTAVVTTVACFLRGKTIVDLPVYCFARM